MLQYILITLKIHDVSLLALTTRDANCAMLYAPEPTYTGDSLRYMETFVYCHMGMGRTSLTHNVSLPLFGDLKRNINVKTKQKTHEHKHKKQVERVY